MREVPLHERGGVITERDTEYVTIRLRIPAGIITPEKMAGVAAIATRYGVSIHLTTRQTIELSHIPVRDLRSIAGELKENGTPVGAEKAEVVNIIACPGLDRCKYAQSDSTELALALDELYFGKEMPVKTRIAISSCPNSCMSEQFNEIGITGVVRPFRISGTCNGCGSCVHYCKQGAISIMNGDINLDDERCNLCGMCIQSCSYDVIMADPPAYRIAVGGKRGMHPKQGGHLVTVKSGKTAVDVVGRVVDWIYKTAWGGTPLADQMDDMGFEAFSIKVKASLPQDEIAPDLPEV